MSQQTNNRASRQEPTEYETKKGCLTLTIALIVCAALTILAIVLANPGAPPH